MKTYFFVLGTHPAISIAEIFVVLKNILGKTKFDYQTSEEILLINTEEKLDLLYLQNKLGGTIKIGEIFKTISLNLLKPELLSELYISNEKQDNKNIIGLSPYQLSETKLPQLKKVAFTMKKLLKKEGVSSRIVFNEDRALTSVQVDKNNLLKKGAEFVLVFDEKQVHIGFTKSVQNFELWNRVDFGRPERDDKSGILPPKLARIILNLGNVQTETKLLDPFCGSGTVLTEAMRLGVKKIKGSDFSAKAISDSQKNIDWLKDQMWFNNISEKVELFKHDATFPFSTEKQDAIIAEGYLGPSRPTHKTDFRKINSDLTNLFNKTIPNLLSALEKNGQIVLIVPESIKFSIKKSGAKQIAPLPEKLLQKFSKHLSEQGNLIYSRPNARVVREILLIAQ